MDKRGVKPIGRTLCPHCCMLTWFEGNDEVVCCVECGYEISTEKFMECK